MVFIDGNFTSTEFLSLTSLLNLVLSQAFHFNHLSGWVVVLFIISAALMISLVYWPFGCHLCEAHNQIFCPCSPSLLRRCSFISQIKHQKAMGCRPNPDCPMLVNKALLGNSYAHLFMEYIWLLSYYNSKVGQLGHSPTYLLAGYLK